MNRIVLFTSMNDQGGQLFPIIQACCQERNWPTFDDTNGVITILDPLAEGGAGNWKLAAIWEYHQNQNEYKDWLIEKEAILQIEGNARDPVAVFCHGNTNVNIQRDQKDFVARLNISDSAIHRTYSHSPVGLDLVYDKLVQILEARNNQDEFMQLFDKLWLILSGEDAYEIAIGIAAACLPTYLASSLAAANPSYILNVDVIERQIDMLSNVSPNSKSIDPDEFKSLVRSIANGHDAPQDVFKQLVEALRVAYEIRGQ